MFHKLLKIYLHTSILKENKMKIQEKVINNLRVLSCETISNAGSGHSGIALSAAPILYSLYANHIQVNPQNPHSLFRDRFVLSAGHGSALLYSTLHMFGYNISTQDLKQFRVLGSKTPGHPEIKTPGVDCSTGPLGQGVASAVGLAIAERHMASIFNKKDIALIDNYTYALVGDGCLMEGVANEALSLAGTLKLNKLIVLYDCNKVSLDSAVDITFAQDTKKVFEGYGFNVIEVVDGNDAKQISVAITAAKRANKPSLIIVNTRIGFGSMNEGSHKSHGDVLDADAIQELKNKFYMTSNAFSLLPEVKDSLRINKNRWVNIQQQWDKKIKNYEKLYNSDYKKLQRMLSDDFSALSDVFRDFKHTKNISMRDAGKLILNKINEFYPNIIGGSADLSSSTKTYLDDEKNFNLTPSGKNIFYGVREFAMGAIANGISLYGGLRTFASTFSVFSDYLKNAIRMSSLMNIPTLYVFTHTGFESGGDGPTHQAYEHIAGLIAMPNLHVFKPCNFEEAKAGYYHAFNSKNPTALILSRGTVGYIASSMADALKGGYILSAEDKKKKLDGIFLSSGSECEIILQAKELLKNNYNIRVVSLPCTELFDAQPKKYIEKVIPSACKNVMSVEMGSTMQWYKYVPKEGLIHGIDVHGESGTVESLKEHFGFTPDKIAQQMIRLIKKNKK